MIGLVTSFLVGLTIREHPAHSACLELFETGIQGVESSAGIKRIATTGWRDFRIFGVFDLIHLTSRTRAGSKPGTEN